jgi:hypothetical protein
MGEELLKLAVTNLVHRQRITRIVLEIFNMVDIEGSLTISFIMMTTR